jgi:tetratricopeptide (TPR) repeat protein
MTNDLRFRTRSLLRRTTKPRIAQFNLNQYITSAVAVIVVLFAAASVIYFYSRNDVESASPVVAQNETKQAITSEDDDRLRPFKRTVPAEYDGPSLTEELIADAAPANEAEETLSLMDEFNERPEAESSPFIGSDSIVPAPVKTRSETVYVALNNEPSISKERQAEYDSAKTLATLEDASGDMSTEDDMLAQDKVPTTTTRNSNSVPATANAITQDGKTFEDPAKAWRDRQEKKAALTKKGELFFNTSKYTDAEKVFLELYTMDQLDPKTQYYLGSTYFYLGRPGEATIYLEQVVRVSSDYLEEAQWRLVDAYLAVSKLDDAKKLLKKISKQNGKYSDRAQAKYKDLK